MKAARLGLSLLAVGSLFGILYVGIALPAQAGTESVTIKNGDTNGDGTIDISDAVYTLLYLFRGGEPPAVCADSPATLAQLAAAEAALAVSQDALAECQALLEVCENRPPPNCTPVTILETSGPGTTNGGTSLSPSQLLGGRFEIAERTMITQIGGHIKSSSDTADRSLFAAVVPLSGADLLPSDDTLSDAVFSATFEAPFNDVGPHPYQVPDTVLNTSITLDPGNYGLVFGSGLFGATGSGWMPVSGPIQDLPYFFAMNRHIGDFFRTIPEQPVRFLVRGIAWEQ